MEKKTYPVHIRKKDKSLRERIKGWPSLIRFFWYGTKLISLLCMVIFLVIAIINIRSRESSVSILVPVMLTIVSGVIFSHFQFTKGRSLPEHAGRITLGEDIRFWMGNIRNTPQKGEHIPYEDIEVIYIGACPEILINILVLWVDRGVSRRIDPCFSECYGNRYIVGVNKSKLMEFYKKIAVGPLYRSPGIPLFALTYNEEAYQTLLRKCKNAKVYKSEEEYLAPYSAAKTEANRIEKEMAEKSGVQDFDGYVN